MLQVENLNFHINDNNTVKFIVNDANFTVNDGELLVITGPNGGGKSTLARLLVGLEQPSSGKIILDGKDITDMDIDSRAKAGIGYAFQQPPRFKGMTVSKLLSIATGITLTRDESCALLSRVGLCAMEYIDRQVDGTLSGGEMKRIEIATVIAKDHSLYIFDEPEAGIDLWSFSMLVREFEKMHKKGDRSIIIISHQERIIALAARIMVVQDGIIKQLGRREDVLPGLNDAGCPVINSYEVN